MLKEIVKKCSALTVYAKRSLSDTYCELVFHTEDTAKWAAIFADILGQAIKPAGARPTEEDLSLTLEHGGIHNDQTLFKKELDGITVIAMFWPWQNGIYTTLRLAVLQQPKK